MSIGETVVVDESGPRNALPVLLGILGGLVVLALLWLFVISPIVLDDPLAADAPVASGGPDVPDGVVATDEPDDEPTEVATGLTDLGSTIQIARDPFEPVRDDPEDEAATDADGDPSGVEATIGLGSDDDPDGDPTDDGGSDEACQGGEQQMTCDGQTLTLVAAERDSGFSAVRVDTAVYDVREGDVFADVFALLVVDDPCVTIFYDEEVFDLCEGEDVLK